MLSLRASDRSSEAGGRASARRLLATLALTVLTAVRVPATAASSGEPHVTVLEKGGVYSVAATFDVSQPASVAVAVLTDYEQIPRFMPDVRTSTILERSRDRVVVEQESVARFMMFSKRIHLVLEITERLDVLRFRDRCGRSFERYEGMWRVSDQNGKTAIVYELIAQPSFDVPEFLLKRLLTRNAAQMIEQLQREIAARSER